MEELFQRYLDNDCTQDEIKALFQYFGSEENEAQLKNLIRQSQSDDEVSSGKDMKYLLDATFLKIKKAIATEAKVYQAPIVPFYTKKWFRASAAAVIFILFSASAFFVFRQKDKIEMAQKIKNIPTPADILPGTSNAVLTLDDGTTIVLDSAANGTLATQGNTKVLKLNGQIVYNKAGGVNAKPIYNTITTANGNQYQLILTDGSKVWLNATSSIRFPTAFCGNERRVEITGEAYFEVAHDATKPFRVFISPPLGEPEGAEIEVLGTHFNVNTYPDEPDMKTTLLEGSVKIKNAHGVKMLAPGQQARITSTGIAIKKNVDIDNVMAWKNGYFLFDNTDIYTLMRQVSRWYNIDIKYEGKITEEGFSGKISRDVPLSTFIKVLKLNDVQVTTEGRKMIVGLSH